MTAVVTWRRSDVLFRTTGRGLLVLGADAADVILVPGVGGALWELLAEPMAEPAIIQAIADLINVEPASVEDHVCRLIADLADRGLVRSG